MNRLALFAVIVTVQYVSVVTFQACTNPSLINAIQKLQWAKARLEIAWIEAVHYKNSTVSAKNDHLQFYTESYFILPIPYHDLKSDAQYGSLSMCYHSIYKNANTYIRYWLMDIVKSRRPNRITSLNSTGNDKPVLVDYSSKEVLRSRPTSAICRQVKSCLYSFTFLRNPIARFISGYSEVEIRVMKSTVWQEADLWSTASDGQSKLLPGSTARVEAFIQWLLQFDGHENLFRSLNVADHIAAQVGTLTAARSLKQQLHLYKLENFRAQWAALANDSGVPTLLADSTQFDKGFRRHESSLDVLNTTAAAKLLLGPALDQLSPQNTGTNAATQTLEQRKAVSYVRVLCRLYLVDFLCGDYSLPAVCEDMLEEISEAQLQLLILQTAQPTQQPSAAPSAAATARPSCSRPAAATVPDTSAGKLKGKRLNTAKFSVAEFLARSPMNSLWNSSNSGAGTSGNKKIPTCGLKFSSNLTSEYVYYDMKIAPMRRNKSKANAKHLVSQVRQNLKNNTVK